MLGVNPNKFRAGARRVLKKGGLTSPEGVKGKKKVVYLGIIMISWNAFHIALYTKIPT